MSVFRGSIIECPSIIIDHFTPSNCLRGRAFFLSHCHRDHMTGLDSSELLFALASKSTHLYCSEVTKGLLSGDARFTKLIPLMKSLPVEEEVTIKLIHTHNDEALNVTVTLLPAGHCPGSVMFLLQWGDSTVLYTGDFRLSLSELKRITQLHSTNGSVINVDTVYLDTTFCHSQAQSIITREDTNKYIIETVEKWLTANPLNTVYLDCPSFGYEHIFLALSSRFNMPIHISPWRMKSYSVLPEVQQSLTLDGEMTRIHSCGYKKKLKKPGLPCGCRQGIGGEPARVLRVKPSTQWFVTGHGRLNHPRIFHKSTNMLRVLHSMHASYDELCAFVTHLSPRSVVPCVIPYSIGDTSIVDLHDRIRKLLPIKAPPTLVSCDNETDTVTTQRKDPVHYEEEEGEGEEGDGSGYETDDEFVSSQDFIGNASHDTRSCDQLSDRSFDLSLAAFNDNNISVKHKPTDQPLIDLCFDGDSIESVGSPAKLVKPLQEVPDSDDVSSPIAKKRKLENDKNEVPVKLLDMSSGCGPDVIAPSLCVMTSSLSPVSFIDLTQTSSSDYSGRGSLSPINRGREFIHNGRDSLTPDSVIITNITHRTSRGSTPIGSLSPPTQLSEESPSFLPPTPGRTDQSNLLSSSNKSLGYYM